MSLGGLADDVRPHGGKILDTEAQFLEHRFGVLAEGRDGVEPPVPVGRFRRGQQPEHRADRRADLLPPGTFGQLGMAEQFGRPVESRVPEPGGLRGLPALGQGKSRRPLADHRVEFGTVRHAVTVVRIAGVVGEIGPVQHVAGQPPPLPVVGRAEHQRLPIGGRVGAVGRDRRGTDAVRLEVEPAVTR